MKIMSTNIQCGPSYLNYIETLMTDNSHLIRFHIDVANCYHKAYCEIFSTATYNWNILFTKDEVDNYRLFDYIHWSRDGKNPNPDYVYNIALFKKHFEKVYANIL